MAFPVCVGGGAVCAVFGEACTAKQGPSHCCASLAAEDRHASFLLFVFTQVAVVGVGGVGSVAAEMLTRCGIGRLLLYGE